MRTQRLFVKVAALALGLGSAPDVAAQSAGERHHNRGLKSEPAAQERDDGVSSSRGEVQRKGERANSRGAERQREDRSSQRAEQRDDGARVRRNDRDERSRGAEERAERSRRSGDERNGDRYDNNGVRSNGRYDNDRNRYLRNSRNDRDDRGRYDSDRRRYDNDRDRYRGRSGNWYLNYRGNWGRSGSGFSFGYYAPRRIYRSYAPRRYYGSSGRLSLSFWSGSGYRYGSPYYGRVYGYRRSAPTYGDYVSYGDVKLKVKPSDAAVYVDGYYAGVVDSFDGLFQELTLEVGAHEIEVVAPWGASEVFDVYVDPYNTIDLHADLCR